MKQTLQKILAILLAAMLLCSLILFAFPAVLPQNFGDGTANEETLPPANEVPEEDMPQEAASGAEASADAAPACEPYTKDDFLRDVFEPLKRRLANYENARMDAIRV